MVKKAVDVVLLPEEAMMDRAIEENAKLVAKFGSEIVLDKSNCLPHISLAMGCINEADVVEIEKVFNKIAEERPVGKLKVCGIFTSVNAKGENVSVYVIEKTEQLQLLHEDVMERLHRYFSYDVTKEMIYGETNVAESTLLWIKKYHKRSSFANYLPHITIGYGWTKGLLSPIEFKASKLALCHLGNHCTCRKILVSVDL
jgi:2'-5' RNA ligase